MNRSWLWVALLLSLGINIGVLATIGTARSRGKERIERSRVDGQPPFARMADHLELEGEVREQFMEIQQELFQTTRRRREHLEDLRGQLRREVTSNDPDSAVVEQLLAELSEVSQDLDRAMVESVLATRRMLSPEQQRSYFQILDRLRPGGRQFGRHGKPPTRRRPSGDRPDSRD